MNDYNPLQIYIILQSYPHLLKNLPNIFTKKAEYGIFIL